MKYNNKEYLFIQHIQKKDNLIDNPNVAMPIKVKARDWRSSLRSLPAFLSSSWKYLITSEWYYFYIFQCLNISNAIIAKSQHYKQYFFDHYLVISYLKHPLHKINIIKMFNLLCAYGKITSFTFQYKFIFKQYCM